MARREDGDLEWRTYGLALGRRLRWLRTHRDLTQEQLAELSGVHRNQISNIERNVSRDDGSADPHLSMIFRLARALNVSPNLLIPNVDNPVASKSGESVSDVAWVAVQTELDERLQR